MDISRKVSAIAHTAHDSLNLIRKQTKMEGGQSGTYLRQTRASSGTRVSVAKTYRDEMKRKSIFRPNHTEIFNFVSSLYVLVTLTCGPDDALVSLR